MTPETRPVRPDRLFQRYLIGPLTTVLRWTVPKIVLLGIVLIWGATVKHDVSFDHFIVEFIFVALLLAVLFYA